MARDVSSTFRQAFFGQQTDEVPLFLATITHPQLGTPLRLVLNTQEITSNGVLYNPMYFTVGLPDEQPNQAPTATMVIDAIDRVIIQAFRTAGVPEENGEIIAPEVSFQIVLSSTPDTVEFVTPPLAWRAVRYSLEKLQGSLTGPAIFNRRFPHHIMSPSTTPGIFKGGPL